MTKSDSAETVARVRELLLPEKGAVFEIQYYDGEDPITYGEGAHSWANAVSAGLKVVVQCPEGRVSHSRQMKPLLPTIFQGPDGAYRRALRISLGGDKNGRNADWYIHIMGGLVVVTKNRINCGQMVNDESLTPTDRIIFDELKRLAEAKAGEQNGGA